MQCFSPSDAPQVTLGLLEEFKKLEMKAAWIQPGAADEAVSQFIVDNGLEERVVWGGPCILVLGDRLLAAGAASAVGGVDPRLVIK